MIMNALTVHIKSNLKLKLQDFYTEGHLQCFCNILSNYTREERTGSWLLDLTNRE